jgi:hypothetical protein
MPSLNALRDELSSVCDQLFRLEARAYRTGEDVEAERKVLLERKFDLFAQLEALDGPSDPGWQSRRHLRGAGVQS